MTSSGARSRSIRASRPTAISLLIGGFLTVATAAEWGAYGSDQDYEFVLGRFLEGLAK